MKRRQDVLRSEIGRRHKEKVIERSVHKGSGGEGGEGGGRGMEKERGAGPSLE